MILHRIADLYVACEYSHATMQKQAKAYISNDKPEIIDIIVKVEPELLEQRHKEKPSVSINDWEYVLTGCGFYTELLHYNGMILHSSAVVVDGKAYLFSAPSGTGKSTHTQLWLKVFGDRAKILNDDKPAIRIIDGTAFAYGTPWSGKTDFNINMRAPIGGICFLSRSKENYIDRVDGKKALMPLMEQTFRPTELESLDMLLNNLRTLMTTVPIYHMGCNMEDEAAIMSYQKMSNNILNK